MTMVKVKNKFRRDWYNRYDSPAKQTLAQYLESVGHEITDTSENYTAADVISTKDGLTYFNEAEVKVSWKAEWPTEWAEIRIPERKTRLLDKYEGADGVLNFYVFRNDRKQVWRIKDTSLTKERLREAKGRNITKGEHFYHIPYNEATLINIGEAA